MSNQSEAATYIQALELNNIAVASSYAMFALLLYDYLLNFSREVNLIWHQIFKPLSLLYILNYYPRIISWLLSTILNSYTPHCTAMLQIADSAGNLSILADIVFQITRTAAIWGQSWIVASILTVLGLPPLVLNFWSIYVDTCANDFAPAAFPKYVFITKIIGVGFSLLVVILTILKTFQSARDFKELYTSHNYNLAFLILTNGSVYFIMIASFNIVGVSFYFFESASPVQGIILDVSSILGTILLSRFMLSLREKVANPNESASLQELQISSLRIAVNHLHSVIDDEFGDPLYNTSYEVRQANNVENITLEDMDTVRAGVTVTAPIDIAEFPWAAGEIELVEADREVAV